MPAKSAEQIKQKTAALKKKLAEKSAALDPVKLRAAKKKIRRLQRRRRLMDGAAKRLKGAEAQKKDEAAKAE
jgi:hypothetical protein